MSGKGIDIPEDKKETAPLDQTPSALFLQTGLLKPEGEDNQTQEKK
jgi:hypothetical protein